MHGRSTITRRLTATGSLLLSALKEWVRDRCEGLAAAMAFNAILAAGPLFALILMTSAGLFGADWARDHVLPVLLAWIGPRGTAVLRFVLLEHERLTPEAIAGFSIAAAIGLLLGTSGFFLQMQDSLETIWNVRREEARLRAQLRKRLFGLLYAIVSALIALCGMAATSLLFSAARPPPGRPVLGGLRLAGEALIAFLVFWALISFWLRVLPPVKLSWRQILPWAGLIAVLHLLGRLVLTWRAIEQEEASAANTAEALILVLLWFHYATMVFLYGAQLMKVFLLGYRGMHLAQPAPDPRR